MNDFIYAAFERLWAHVKAETSRKASVNHTHNLHELPGVVPIYKGGTDATNEDEARYNLKAAHVDHTHDTSPTWPVPSPLSLVFSIAFINVIYGLSLPTRLQAV